LTPLTNRREASDRPVPTSATKINTVRDLPARAKKKYGRPRRTRPEGVLRYSEPNGEKAKRPERVDGGPERGKEH